MHFSWEPELGLERDIRKRERNMVGFGYELVKADLTLFEYRITTGLDMYGIIFSTIFALVLNFSRGLCNVRWERESCFACNLVHLLSNSSTLRVFSSDFVKYVLSFGQRLEQGSKPRQLDRLEDMVDVASEVSRGPRPGPQAYLGQR